jgi:hypothetical protein
MRYFAVLHTPLVVDEVDGGVQEPMFDCVVPAASTTVSHVVLLKTSLLHVLDNI